MITLLDDRQVIPGLLLFNWSGKTKTMEASVFEHNPGCMEIFYSISGNHVFNVNGKDYTLYGGDALILRENLAQGTRKQPSIGELIQIRLDAINRDGFLFLDEKTAAKLISRLQATSEPCVRTDNGLSKQLLRLIISELQSGAAEMDAEKTAAYISGFLYNLLITEKTNSRRATVDIVHACEYIDDNLCGDLQLEDIAKEINLSLSQFKFKFKNQIGISPRTYINQQKIERIKDELRTGKSFTEIAEMYGFCNSAYFSVVFKKYTGETPTDFLNRKV